MVYKIKNNNIYNREMKSNYLIVLIFMILLILLLIFTIICHNFLTVKIELFTNTPTNEFKYPIITNTGNITNVSLSKGSTLYNLYVASAEQYEQSSVNNYIIGAYSSFNIVNGNKLLAILNATGNPVALKPSPKTRNDYIFFEFPEESENYTLTKVIITFNNNYLYYANLFTLSTANLLNSASLTALLNIPANVSTSDYGRKITYTLINNTKIYSNLCFSTTYKLPSSYTMYIKSIEFYFTTDTADTELNGSDVINMLTDNENEYISFDLPDLTSAAVVNNVINTDDKRLLYKYIKILKLKIPWAIYDASTININSTNRLRDTLNRSVRDASITGTTHSIMKDPNNNINYLNGTTATSIQFPNGSFMKDHFTCCIISKYTNPTTNRNTILTDGKDLMIGHYGGTEEIVKITRNPQKQWPINATSRSTNWIITCIKSKGNDSETIKSKSLIINENKITDITIDFAAQYDANLGINIAYNVQNSDRLNELPTTMKVKYDSDITTDINSKNLADYMPKLSINTPQAVNNQYSDFGLAYVIIWDMVLTDNELSIVSKVLNNYIKNPGSYIPSISFSIPIYDGSTMDRPGKSALDIKQTTNTDIDGLYWIKPDGAATAIQVFCIMDSSCNGGGWMLAMKSAQGSTRFQYNSTDWTQYTTVIPPNDKFFEMSGIYMDTTQDAKYDIYNTYKVKDCLAIFDSREFYDVNKINFIFTDPSKPQYGWRWFETGFNNNNPITLLDFFKNNTRIFKYSTSYTGKPNDAVNTDINTQMAGNGTYIPYNDFLTKYIDSGNNQIKVPYTNKIWSNQREYLSYGFNNFTVYMNPDASEKDRVKTSHVVRWGGIFNENTYIGYRAYPYLPNSVDVSGGIGLADKSGGDIASCCAKDWGVNKSLSFKWFIR